MSTESTPTTTDKELATDHLSADAASAAADTQQLIETLLQRVETLETQLAQEQDARKAAEDRIDDLERQRCEDVHALARDHHELRHQQEETDEQLTATEQATHVNRSRLDRFNEWQDELLTFLGVDPNEPLPDEPGPVVTEREDAEAATDSIAQTFIEQLTVLPEGVTNSANVKRARFLAMDLKQYAEKGRDGWILDAEHIKNALYAKEQDPAAAHDQTVERVRNILAENGGDDVTVEQQSRGRRKKVVAFSTNIVSRLTNLGQIREQAPSLVCEDRIPETG